MKQRTAHGADTSSTHGKALVLALVAIALTGTAHGQANAGPHHQAQPGSFVSPTPAPTIRQVKLVNGNELEEPKPLQNNKKNEAQGRQPASAHCDYKTNSYGKFYVCEIHGEKQK